MDEEAEEEIVKHMNPQRGFKSEIDRVLNRNKSLSKSGSWDEPTDQQIKAIRSRMRVNRDKSGVKFQKNDKTYIRVDEDNYKRVTTKNDIYVDEESDRVWFRNSKGQFDELIK